MKRAISLVLGVITVFGMSIATYAATSVIGSSSPTSSLSTVMPRKAYENQVRKISGKSSWTSAIYSCVPGDHFGGGIDDPVTLTGKVQFSSSRSGPWTTLTSKSLNGYDSVGVEVEQRGYYRFILTNSSSSSVSVECYVVVN